jgi:hypothetical protein
MCLRKPKLSCLLTVATLGVGAMGMYPHDSEQGMERFRLGQRLGDCLVKGCVVFTGIVASLGKLEKEPGLEDEQHAVMLRDVNLRGVEWLYGAADGDSVRIVYSQRPKMTKSSLGPWLAWEGVSLEPGGELLVVRWAANAPSPVWQGQPEDVALVVSDRSRFAPIREAIAQHQRFQRDPGSAARIPQLLRDQHDSLFKGYLLKYLMDVEGVRDVDKAAVMLSDLLENQQLPAEARQASADQLVADFFRLSEATRTTVTEAVVAAASGTDRTAANAALSVLVQLGDLQMLALKPLLTKTSQPKIAENYRAFRAQSKVAQPHLEFESQLGVR